MKDSGVEGMIGRSSNRKTNQLYGALGGKILKELHFEENGIQEKVYLISIDFNNEQFINIWKLKEQKNKARAKLWYLPSWIIL